MGHYRIKYESKIIFSTIEFKSMNVHDFHLMDPERRILKDYHMILHGEQEPKFIQSKYQKVRFTTTNPTETLWSIHDDMITHPIYSDSISEQSMLNLKYELARRIEAKCCFCEHRCLVNQSKHHGECGVTTPCISSEFLHGGEEKVLVPSHTIFFSGCTLHCVFCQNWDISQTNKGWYIEPEKTAAIIKKRKAQGSRNVNWVGGDPTPDLSYILDVLRYVDEPIAQVWNSNMYCSSETMHLLNGVMDIYLTDFKFGNDTCAKRLSKVDHYVDIIKRNHMIAYQQGEMITRHLVMPHHIDCCSKPIIDWISKNTPETLVNIMGQYRPAYHATEYEEILSPVTSSEVQEIKDYARKKGVLLI
jgi:putative pyruvate formate lyase activating enzyme